MVCKICSGKVDHLFKRKILEKYIVDYFQCSRCLFIQTEPPFWLNEAYENIITSLDIGLVSRNMYLATIVKSIINAFFNVKARFLDYGGGYGLLVRIMRDEGFDFYRQDKFCENLFSKNFDIGDIPEKSSFELVTAFELFEHFEDPLTEFEKIYENGKNILVSTELQPDKVNIEQWEYLAEETGQHIALYHYKTLAEIGKKFKMNLYSNQNNIHLFTTKRINETLFSLLTKKKVSCLYNILSPSKNSLLKKDYDMIKRRLKSN